MKNFWVWLQLFFISYYLEVKKFTWNTFPVNIIAWDGNVDITWLSQTRFLCGFIPENSDNKPRGLYFSKAFLEGLTFGGAYIRRGLSTEGNLRFKIDWASLIVERKFTLFALFYFVLEGNFQVQAPGEAYNWRGDLTESFLRYEFGGAYTWRGLFSKFYGNLRYFFVTCYVVDFYGFE